MQNLDLTGNSTVIAFDLDTVIEDSIVGASVVLPAITSPDMIMNIRNKSGHTVMATTSTDEINYSQSEPASIAIPSGKVLSLRSICLGMWGAYTHD